MQFQRLLNHIRESSGFLSDKNQEKRRIVLLRKSLQEKIAKHGSISFYDFMTSALYDPSAGFYMKRIVFGEGDGQTCGDFITSPQNFSPYYGQAIASLISQLHTANKTIGGIQRIVSIAAGDGTLDRDLLDWLEKNEPDLYKNICYESVEISQRQITLQKKMLGRHAKKVTFVEESGTDYLRKRRKKLQHTFLFSNEWLDTMPVHIVRKDAQWREVHVTKNWRGSFFRTIGEIQDNTSVTKFLSYAKKVGRKYDTAQYANYDINVHTQMVETAELLSQALVSGFSLMIDYGIVGAEPPQTILTFTRNKKLQKVLTYPGSIDITTYIDWDIWIEASKPLLPESVTCDLILMATMLSLDLNTVAIELQKQIKNPAVLQSAGGYTISKKLRERLSYAEELSVSWFHEGLYGSWIRSPYPASSIKTFFRILTKKLLAGEKTH